jgi:hypothetical protein
MTITLNADYDVTLSTALLGYVGETNARPVSVEGLTVDGADRYVLTIDYGDGTVYEVDITGGTWTPTADILRSAQTVSCQIAAKKLAGDEYILVKKSRIFRLRIGTAIGDNAIPSPDVAMDALDRIDAIGRQAHADMQTAATAAETATTAAENAKKSATTAEKSADTATQAASRAETAKTAAETSATQADTAKQGAETARTEAVTSQNAAKVSAAQAATSAQQTTADKNITAGYAKTAKTNADSTATDRQAVQDMATQVTADKATVADHAAQVATDRKAAETAAQTAQVVADSLPEDYVTAVAKIAENTANIGRVKLTDKELQRRVNALYDIGQGVTHKFETDTDTAYAKTVPTGAKLMSVKSIGGRNLVFNQIVNPNNFRPSYTMNGVTFTKIDNVKFVANGTATGGDAYFSGSFVPIKGHVYLEKSCPKGGSATTYRSYLTGSGVVMDTNYGSGVIAPLNVDTQVYMVPLMVKSGATVNNLVVYPQIYDLTAMFGSGNEPSTAEEFEAMFPADYYPYNAGEIVSAGVTEIVEQGKNVFDYTDKIYHGANASKVENGIVYTKGLTTTVLNIPTIIGNKYTLSFKVKSNTANQGGLRWSIQRGKNTSYAHDSSLIKSEVGYEASKEYQAVATFVADTDFVSLCTIEGMVYDVQLELGDTATDYSPFYQTEYPIPEAIRNLPGYGVEGNIVDYENKTYTQVNSVSGTEIKALATPIVTDISTLIDDDFLRNLTVEAGGSVTFKNSNGDSYRIPVPSEEEYIVKLSEVGGTT